MAKSFLTAISVPAGATGTQVPQRQEVDTLLAAKQDTADKDASGGYVGLTALQINFKNIANTITSFFTNSNSAVRTYTFPDKDGTVALVSNELSWNTNGKIAEVAGMLGWKNYGNAHIIFDASNSTSPTGSVVNNTNPEVAWSALLPTLMGWNGINTFGVRVDSARAADNATSAVNATYLSATQQINLITGKQASMSMSQDGGATKGSFTCRATGANDANLAGMTYWNDAYALKLGVRADGYFGLGGWSRAAWSWYSDPSGNMVAAGNVTAYSDPRLKENFKRVSEPLKILSKLDGGTFNWKHGFAHTKCKAGNLDYGILADQVESVMPEIVTDSIEIDGKKYKTVAYEKLIPVLIEALKEQQKQIDALNRRFEQLELVQ